VTGGGGIVGSALARTKPDGIELTSLRHADLDVTDRPRALDAIVRLEPRWVVHLAAMTDVDGCEGDPERAFRVNWLGAANVVDAALLAKAAPICLSTDYVFDGARPEPYVEHDEPRPLSVYGRSKLFAEREALSRGGRVHVVRTQWIFGAGGRNFVDTILRTARERPQLKVVADQRGCPTWSVHLAQGLWRLIEADPGPGIWHMAARGAATWHDFARAIVAGSGLKTAVAPCTTAEFPRPARRPPNGVLRNFRLELSLGDFMPPWEEGLRGYLSELRGTRGGGS
jgi:dTDP-4-dehydrorhamnose reductase